MSGDQIYVRMSKPVKEHFVKRLKEVGYRETSAQALRLAMLSMIMMNQKELKTFIDQSKLFDVFVLSKIEPNNALRRKKEKDKEYQEIPFEEITNELLSEHRGTGLLEVVRSIKEDIDELERITEEMSE